MNPQSHNRGPGVARPWADPDRVVEFAEHQKKQVASIAANYDIEHGHTRKLAEAGERGAKGAGGTTTLLPVTALGKNAPP